MRFATLLLAVVAVAAVAGCSPTMNKPKAEYSLTNTFEPTEPRPLPTAAPDMGPVYARPVHGPEYQASNARACRDYTQIIYIDGERHLARNTACRNEDGSWTPIWTQF